MAPLLIAAVLILVALVPPAWWLPRAGGDTEGFPCRERTETRVVVRRPTGDSTGPLRPKAAARVLRKITKRERRRVERGFDGRHFGRRFVQVETGSWDQAPPEEVAELIRCHAPHFGIDPDDSITVGSCESGLRWDAENGPHKSIFQHNERYWPDRAANAGLPGASIWDVYAQVHVTHSMVAEGGWGPWECRP